MIHLLRYLVPFMNNRKIVILSCLFVVLCAWCAVESLSINTSLAIHRDYELPQRAMLAGSELLYNTPLGDIKTFSSSENGEPPTSALLSSITMIRSMELYESVDPDLEEVSLKIKSSSFDLMSTNPDVVGWIHVPDTVINYPIVYGHRGDNYYLDRDINGKSSKAGSIYLDDSSGGEFGELNLIHGHSMRDGTMFGSLLKYKQQKYADEHKYMYVYDGVFVKKYEVFACVLLNANNEGLQVFFSSAVERDRYYDQLIRRSVLEPQQPADPADVIALNTCSYESSNFRCLVFASCVAVDRR